MTALTYDANGNVTRVSDGIGATTFEYNGPGKQLGKVTDGRGNFTTYGYNASSELQTVTRPAPLGATGLTYDAPSRIATVTDGKGQIKTYTYDPLDGVKRIDWSDGSSVAYTYDANGDTLTWADASPTQTTTYSYDALNRMTQESLPGAKQNVYTYDRVGNLVAFQDSGGTVDYTYDVRTWSRRSTSDEWSSPPFGGPA